MNERQIFQTHIAPTSSAALGLQISRAEGIYLYDENGKEIIDLISGISVSNLGHCCAEITEAIQKQSALYAHIMVYGETVQSPQTRLAQLLCNQLHPSLNCIFYTNSGTEATEGAMKLAKKVTGRTRFISCKNAYHGSTQGALSILGSEYFKRNYRPLLPDCVNITYGEEADLTHICEDTAAVVIEPVQAESGVQIATTSYFEKLRKRCSDTGTLLIFDEIQTGFGRTGSLFRHQYLNIIPDIMLLGKAFGAGLPLGGFIADRKLMHAFTENPVLGNINTFGGNAICCAAAFAGLQTLLENDYIQRVNEKSNLFQTLLQHPAIKSFRSAGLLISIELLDFDFNLKVTQKCLEKGVFTDWFLFAPQCLRIAPPLIINFDEIKKACNIILESIEEVCNEK